MFNSKVTLSKDNLIISFLELIRAFEEAKKGCPKI